MYGWLGGECEAFDLIVEDGESVVVEAASGSVGLSKGLICWE